MKYVEAVNEWEPDGSRAAFLAGGITGCPDWQSEVSSLLADCPVTLINPRRANFPINDRAAAPEQVAWEHRHLRKASAILFWFPCETLCPIALYELGAWSMTDKQIFIGAHPDYARRFDVVLQTRLVRPGVSVVTSIQELVACVKVWIARCPS
jgi:hypothetical protein